MSANGSREGNPGPSRRDIILPAWHDKIISDLMREQGIGRSEAVRQIVKEWHQGGARGVRYQILSQIRTIRGHVQVARGQPEMASHALAQIEAGLETISRITGADALIT